MQKQHLANSETCVVHETMLLKIRNILLMRSSKEVPWKGEWWNSGLPLSPYSCIPRKPDQIACHYFRSWPPTCMGTEWLDDWKKYREVHWKGNFNSKKQEDMWKGFIHGVSFIIDMSFYIRNSEFCMHKWSAHLSIIICFNLSTLITGWWPIHQT